MPDFQYLLLYLPLLIISFTVHEFGHAWVALQQGDRGLSDLYARAAALVFPSRGEGWGIPVLNSLARGTPVIA